jgi:ectoine hydroxylase-related dioxygenase (phytanoyl-CoA dioxygenase family)
MITEITQKGYTVLTNFWLPKDILDSVSRDIEAVAEKSDSNDVFKCEHGIKQIQNLQNHLEYFMIGVKLKQLLREPSAKILNMQYFIKYPDYKITSPHQDGAYFDEPKKNIITLWIPLQDVNKDNSCLFYLPSDKKKLIKHKPIGKNVRTRTGKTGVSQYSDKYKLEEFVEVPMKYGDVVIHDQFSMHYSSENHSDTRRIALTCILELP